MGGEGICKFGEGIWWVDFLIIVSAPGPGWLRFDFIKQLGASKKFVGGW